MDDPLYSLLIGVTDHQPTYERGTYPMTMLDTKDLSQLLKVSERTIRRWCTEDRLPHLKISKTLRFRENEILNLLETGR